MVRGLMLVAMLLAGSPAIGARNGTLSCSRIEELGGSCNAWWEPLAWVAGFFLVIAGGAFIWLLWSARAPARPTEFPLEPPDTRGWT
jgi:hypothetical protein